MKTAGALSGLLSFAAKHERRLGAALFAFGFILDLFTFGLLPIETVNILFVGYLFLAAGAALGSHYFADVPQKEGEPWWKRTLAVVLPLAVQYAFGGLLSGLFVFYAVHSFIFASWPFILILGAMYFGNEYFRMYKQYLVFQTALLFFTFYAYAVFALPLFVGKMGAIVFLGSTVAAIVLFALFLFLLKWINKKRLLQSLRPILYATGGIVAVVCLSYFLNIIPPVPLTLSEHGVYHSLSKTSTGYLVQGEAPNPWWNPFPQTVHYRPGETIYAFSAVSAPIRFSTAVAHRWEQHVDGKGWVTVSRVSFPIYGGRKNGYRGYSYHSNLAEGTWRVSVETLEGLVIGRMQFNVKETEETPALVEKEL